MEHFAGIDYLGKGAAAPAEPPAMLPIGQSPASEKIIFPQCRLWLTSTERQLKPLREMAPEERSRYGPQIKNERLEFYEDFRRHLGGFLRDCNEEEMSQKLSQAVERYCADAKALYGRLIEVAQYWEKRVIGDLDNAIIPQLDNLRVAPLFLKEDAVFINHLLTMDPHLILYVSDVFKRDRNAVMKAVKTSGSLLMHMKDEFKLDRAVVLAALENDGLALQHVGAYLRDDREVALAAVRQNGLALRYVAEDLKQQGDWEVIIAAIKQNPQAIIYAGERFFGGWDHFSATGDEHPLFAWRHGEHEMAPDHVVAAPDAGIKADCDAKAVLEIALKHPRILDFYIEGHPIWDNGEFVWGLIEATNRMPKRVGMKLRNEPHFILTLMEKRSKKLGDGRHDSYVLANYAGGELRGNSAFLRKLLMFRIDVALIATWIGKDDFFVPAGFDDFDMRR